jgi:hypothetical protein
MPVGRYKKKVKDEKVIFFFHFKAARFESFNLQKKGFSSSFSHPDIDIREKSYSGESTAQTQE